MFNFKSGGGSGGWCRALWDEMMDGHFMGQSLKQNAAGSLTGFLSEGD